ncbi:uncharacterized protein LOC121757685 [Salvia splendens]|uniref:uncharacterized protein LOC121757685 n=1 Tax=Salvia splendens TaxID=180675 RepID=UPI001C26B927|nr:uncharacterized protein LOC121757685 [Salvia splendens]
MRAERAHAKAEKEKRAREVVPVMNMFSHGRDTKNANQHLTKFVEIANTTKINGVDDDIVREIPRYAKLLSEADMKKQKLQKSDLKLSLHCSEIIQKQRPVKQRDPGQFIISCSIGNDKVDKALCDLGASINIMPLEYYEKLNIWPLKSTDVCLRMVDNTTTKVVGVIEDVLVKVNDFIFTVDFFVLDMKVDKQVPLMLGRNFLATCKALIDVGRGEITISDHGGK